MDERRYLLYAENLSKGFYSPHDDILLLNAPGYPAVLVPFVISNIPLIFPKLLNAFLFYATILYCYRTLAIYIDGALATLFSYMLGIYVPIYKYLPLLMSEVTALFFVSGFIYHYCNLCSEGLRDKRQVIYASIYLSALIWTRSIFFYVATTITVCCTMAYLFNRKKILYKTGLITSIALILFTPYLIYTYSLSGRPFYLGTNGGEVLYWLTTPFEKEYGEWIGKKQVYSNPEIAKNHKSFFMKLEPLSNIEKDNKFKEEAIDNIKRHPLKFVKNWVANIGRLFFNYPLSYSNQGLSTYIRLIPNMFLVVLTILCIYPFIKFHDHFHWEIPILLAFALVYLGGISLVAAINRYFTIVVPFFLVWIAYIMGNFISVTKK